MARMQWHKVFNQEWIGGSIRYELTPAERSVWADFLALAGLSRRQGFIEYAEGKAYTEADICKLLNITITLLHSTLDKCIAEGRVTRHPNNTLEVTNWEKYQGSRTPQSKGPREQELKERLQLQKLGRKYPNDAAELAPPLLVSKETGEVIRDH